jgi:Tfp pilus assembly protein PilF
MPRRDWLGSGGVLLFDLAAAAAPTATAACTRDNTPAAVSCAKRQFEQVLQKDPQEKYAWYNLAVIAQGDKDATTAARDYEQAIAIDPKFESALYNLGLLRFHANDIQEAISDLGRAVAANPRDACAHWALGFALNRAIGRAGGLRATNEMRAALKLDPALIKSIRSSKVKPNEVPGC